MNTLEIVAWETSEYNKQKKIQGERIILIKRCPLCFYNYNEFYSYRTKIYHMIMYEKFDASFRKSIPYS